MDLSMEECLRRLEDTPTDLGVLDELIARCSENRHVEDAARALWVAVAHASRTDDGKRGVELLRRLVEVDPSETRSLGWLAEFCARRAFPVTLGDQIERAAVLYRQQHDVPAMVRWVLTLASLKHHERRFADLLAAPWLEQIKRHAADEKALTALGALYEALDFDEQAAEYLARVAEGHAASGALERAKAVLERVVRLAPARVDLHRRLTSLADTLQVGVGEALPTQRAAVERPAAAASTTPSPGGLPN